MRLVKRDLEVFLTWTTFDSPTKHYHATRVMWKTTTEVEWKREKKKLTSYWEWRPFRGWRTGVVPPSIRNKIRPCRSWWRGSSAPNWSQSPPTTTRPPPPTRSPISSRPCCCPIVSKHTLATRVMSYTCYSVETLIRPSFAVYKTVQVSNRRKPRAFAGESTTRLNPLFSCYGR